MRHSVLVVTATPGFGDLICQTLVETGSYQADLADRAGEALGTAHDKAYELAILDSEVVDIPLPAMVQALRKVIPGIHIVVIRPDNIPHDPRLEPLDIQGFLSKPFYLPDLLKTVDSLLQSKVPTAPPAFVSSKPAAASRPAASNTDRTPPPAWLQDVSRAAQHLTMLSLESSAQAALIVKDGSLWAYAGQLSQPAAQELAVTAANYWAQEREMPPAALRETTKSDMARFIRLGSTGGEYMVYATSLGGGLILTLAFDAETPFSKIRSQASHLARALSSPPGTLQVTPIETKKTSAVLPQVSHPVNLPEAGKRPTSIGLPVTAPAARLRPQPNDIPDLSENWLQMDNLPGELFTDEEDQDLEQENSALQPVTTHVPGTAHVVFDPTMPGMVNLVYACVIIPRLPQHHLTGDLTEKLVEWVGQLCLAFAWRLEYISISPEYVQWVVNVSPSTSPSYLMRILRQHTSQRIFSEFPDLARANPSGDFWAPGYLIMSSSQPPPEPVVREFIRQIRQHQGASTSYPPRFQR